MERIFSILAVFAVLMVLLTGGGFFWLSTSDLTQSKQDGAAALVKALAYNVSWQMSALEDTLAKVATDTDVIAALESGNQAQMKAVAAKIQNFIPNAQKLRILPPNVNSTDESEMPVFGYADLEMVKKTLTAGKQPSIIQGEGENRHLAIATPVKKNEQVIGVVLASLKVDFLQNELQKAPITNSFIEIKQANITLASAGEPDNKTETPEQLQIQNSSWMLFYSFVPDTSLSSITMMIVIALVLSLLTCGASFFGYYQINQLLKRDQNSVLQAVKDLMTGKALGNYPVNLAEIKVIISTLVQFKRILDSKQPGATTDNHHPAPEKIQLDDDDILNVSTSMTGDSELGKKGTSATASLKKKLIPSKAKPKPKPEPKSTATAQEEAKPKPDTQTNTTTAETKKVSASTGSMPAAGIFKAYDIRGIVGKDLSKEIVYEIGLALGSEAKQKNIKTMVVARDGRTSSPSLADGLIKGICSTGCNVLDIGQVPTPVLYFVTQHIEGRSGVMLTGSHNPAEYNGLKMVLSGEALAGDKIQRLRQRIEQETFLTGTMGTVEQNDAFVEEYIGTICDGVVLKRALKVVIDCGNGVAGELAPELLKALGCEVTELFCEIDGNFPNHHPDPSKPENLKDLITAVKNTQADIGLAFDGDGDRLGVIDSAGKIIWPDRQLMLFAKHVLAAKPAGEVIYDVKCTRHLEKQIRKFGGRSLMWKTGHSLMKVKLKETGAVLAGEMSGHIFFNDRWFGFDDGLYAAARLLEILAADTRSSSAVFADFPDSINTPELNIELKPGENFSFMQKLLESADFPEAKIIDIDGLRVEFKDGWALVRASNTTPSLVLRFEADDAAALQRIQQQIKAALLSVKADIKLPF